MSSLNREEWSIYAFGSKLSVLADRVVQYIEDEDCLPLDRAKSAMFEMNKLIRDACQYHVSVMNETTIPMAIQMLELAHEVLLHVAKEWYNFCYSNKQLSTQKMEHFDRMMALMKFLLGCLDSVEKPLRCIKQTMTSPSSTSSTTS